MRAQSSIRIKLSENMAKGGEYGNHYWPETTDEHERGDSRGFTIPASTDDFEIDLTDLISTGSILALRTNQSIQLRINDVGNDQFPVTVVSEGRYGYFYITGNVTKLFVTTGTAETKVVVGFAGDA